MQKAKEEVESAAGAEDEEYNPESANPDADVDDDQMDVDPETPEVEPDEHKSAIWRGKVVYQDFAQFEGVILPLYGETTDVLKDFPASFEVQGRIGPDVVWDYLGKIKRCANRDIAVVRFVPRSAKELATYETMYSYFETKNRLGVLKPKSDVIKDFYLVPQKKGKLLPSVLLTLKGLGSYETKANCIVGIVVKAVPAGSKRPAGTRDSGITAAKVAKRVVREEPQQYTPPGSPKGSKIPLPVVVGGGVVKRTGESGTVSVWLSTTS